MEIQFYDVKTREKVGVPGGECAQDPVRADHEERAHEHALRATRHV